MAEDPTRLQPLTPKPRQPRPHQQRAIRDVLEGFEPGDRGQTTMACGTGKTLDGLWIAEALEAQRTLVLVPSLSLLAQTVREWKLTDARGFEFFAVCSDQTVVDEDAMVAHTADLPFTGVTTDPERIAAFLRGRGPRVMFSTYQSSPRIAGLRHFLACQGSTWPLPTRPTGARARWMTRSVRSWTRRGYTHDAGCSPQPHRASRAVAEARSGGLRPRDLVDG